MWEQHVLAVVEYNYTIHVAIIHVVFKYRLDTNQSFLFAKQYLRYLDYSYVVVFQKFTGRFLSSMRGILSEIKRL